MWIVPSVSFVPYLDLDMYISINILYSKQRKGWNWDGMAWHERRKDEGIGGKWQGVSQTKEKD